MERQFQLGGMFWLDNAGGIEYQTADAYVIEDTGAAPPAGNRRRRVLICGAAA